MDEKQILLKRIDHSVGIRLPYKATYGSSGYDIYAANYVDEDPIVLQPKSGRLIPTGFSVEIPYGFELQIRTRSGLAVANNVVVLNSPGTIDSDYRGEIKVLLFNFGDYAFEVKRGMRIAQLVPMRVATELKFVNAEKLSDTKRGSGGFGHSGV